MLNTVIADKPGNQSIAIDWDHVEKLLHQGEDGLTIADLLDIHHNTLYEYCKREHGCLWSVWARSRKAKCKIAIRSKMFAKAMGKKDNPLSGDTKCLMHLAKHVRGEWDKINVSDIETHQDTQTHNDNDEMDEKHRLRKKVDELEAKLANQSQTRPELCGSNSPL
jgi:hypothetical protein